MSVIDDYLGKVNSAERNELERIRTIVREVLPDAGEIIKYGMPTMTHSDKPILGFDAHKNHIGIYPYSGQVIANIKQLNKYDTTKAAIREKLDDPLPKNLIVSIIKERLNLVSEL